MPVYWKAKYATRSQRHRAWVRQQARREAALRSKRKTGRVRRWLLRLRGKS